MFKSELILLSILYASKVVPLIVSFLGTSYCFHLLTRFRIYMQIAKRIYCFGGAGCFVINMILLYQVTIIAQLPSIMYTELAILLINVRFLGMALFVSEAKAILVGYKKTNSKYGQLTHI
uniref:7TM_GPCR_Srx domain-containing protein n=1 Tax=Rhabditophanes sp. KR3021 TaxID=114890 RepID=A0AC35UD63_9BILA